MLLAAMLSLQGCAAALLPIAAAGALSKTQVDAAERARNAEDALGGEIPEALPEAPAEPQATQAIVTVGDEPPSVSALPLSAESFLNPYAAFVSYALERQGERTAGKDVRGAVLVENVSLTDPKMMSCGSKPMAVIIDTDRGASSAPVQAGLGEQLGRLRAADIRIAWIGDGDQNRMETALTPLLADDDLVLPMRADKLRKQERRWKLAKDYCVIAVAGDIRADFDELYDYLRVPDYAIRLDAFWKRGWFELPAPLAN